MTCGTVLLAFAAPLFAAIAIVNAIGLLFAEDHAAPISIERCPLCQKPLIGAALDYHVVNRCPKRKRGPGHVRGFEKGERIDR